ncbi:hypothetical protein GCM10009737_09060 [Nocardioides lentus]|uniref:Pyroglutamyl peptidase n=1 Tax=Nocardioides lentus TaxID=338077 RepID=A0ABP5ACZ0_9ACTN
MVLSAAVAAPAGCLDTGLEPTVEQERLTRPQPRAILRRSTADEAVAAFARALCDTGSVAAARPVVQDAGRGLWRWATERAQGERRVRGSLPGGDDRPLYWARVAMTRVLAQWAAERDLGVGGLTDRLETTSRGQDTLRVPTARGATRVVVTGFDPFTLDVDARIGNPSGATAIALDGRVVRTADGPVRLETAVFPVRWDDFAAGEVERTLAPFVRRDPDARQGLDALVTVSQGRPEQFDLEVWNGANRGGFADNANVELTGLAPIPPGYPTVRPQPQFTRTDLPVGAMARRDTGRYDVVVNPEITERDPATGETRTTRSGPTPGFLAVAGSPGDYLSNEIAYRATLLRDGRRSPHVGGHVHTPVLGLPAGDRLSGRSYESRRTAMVRQTTALVRAALDLRPRG